MSSQCIRGNHPLDAEARGGFCSICWFAYICSLFTPEELHKARMSTRLIEGKDTWFLAKGEDKEVPLQGTLFL